MCHACDFGRCASSQNYCKYHILWAIFCVQILNAVIKFDGVRPFCAISFILFSLPDQRRRVIERQRGGSDMHCEISLQKMRFLGRFGSQFSCSCRLKHNDIYAWLLQASWPIY